MIAERDIHMIQGESGYILFHPESLSIFSITKDIAEILQSCEGNYDGWPLMDANVIRSSNHPPSILNYIFEKIKNNPAKDPKWDNLEPRSLNLLVSQDCNLKCGYCYADHGTYGYEKKLMKFDTAKKCVDKLLSEHYDTHIVFFGGEPLLNFSLIKKLDYYLNKKSLHAKYTAITNGTIMSDEIKDFISQKFFNLCISLDGSKDINDRQRFGLTESVYDRVAETIEMLYPRDYTILVKSVITKLSVNKLMEITEHIGSLKIDSIAIEPVRGVPHDNEFFMTKDDYSIYINDLVSILVNNLNKLAMGEQVRYKSHIFSLLIRILTRTRKINMCSAGREFLTITADGDVYPCHMFIGLKEFYMGNVHDEDFPGEKFKMIRKLFYDTNVYTSTECNNCWARFLCGGECHWNSYISHGDMSQPTEERCLEMKSIIEALLPEIAYILQDDIKTRNLLTAMKLYKEKEEISAISC